MGLDGVVRVGDRLLVDAWLGGLLVSGLLWSGRAVGAGGAGAPLVDAGLFGGLLKRVFWRSRWFEGLFRWDW